MNLTQQQIEALKGKCPACEDGNFLPNTINSICLVCNGTGLPTIEIKKEWVECDNLGDGSPHSKLCSCSARKIPKYKIGDEIVICKLCLRIKEIQCKGHTYQSKIKLKIISETEDKWRVRKA